MTKTSTLFFILCLNLVFALAQNKLHITEIPFTYFDSENSKTITPEFRYENTDYLVVQLKDNVSTQLVSSGFTIQKYLGDAFYLVSSNANDTKQKLSQIKPFKIGALKDDSKIDPLLQSNLNITKHVSVSYAHNIQDNTIQLLSNKLGFSIIKIDKTRSRFTAQLTTNQLQEVAKIPFVFYISTFYPNKNFLISESMQMLGINQLRNVEPFNFNLKGEGVSVGVWDEGIVGQHYDLPSNKNHVVDKEFNSFAHTFHPTNVGSFIAGQGTNFISLQGVAPKSDIYYWDVFNDIVDEIESGKNNYNVDISNHSYNYASTNCTQSGFYLPEAADLDKLVYEHPSILPVVAVGNSASLCSLTDTFSSIDIGFQGCKNAITVGWIFSNEMIVGNSGRGPTVDGRLKPELVAKGFGVTMATPNNNYGTGYGSSYSAPQIVGIAALIHQQFKQQYASTPNASLVKAILCNTAKDLGNIGPDYTFGYGLPDAISALNNVRMQHFFEDNVTQNGTKTLAITVPSGVSKLNAMLCWTDKESSPLATNNIVNNLDLKIVTPNGDTILPWKLYPNFYKNTATRGVDNLNTIEQVTINTPIAGNYTIVVKGTNVPFGPQDFSVTYDFKQRKIELMYPNGGEILDVGSVTRIRWKNNGMDTLGTIQLSLDSGATWQTIAFNYQLNKQTFDYTFPSIVSKKCLVRILLENNTQSASTFTIGAQVNYSSINATVCDQSAKISWSAFPGASAYNVFLFMDSVWVNVGQSSTTSFMVNNLVNGKDYLYAISTIVNGVEGNHSLAKSFTPIATAACPLNDDVGVYSMHKPTIGRKFTSSSLTATTQLSFIIKNYGTVSKSAIPISYTINSGSVRNAILNDVITSNDTSIVFFTVHENLSSVGNYAIAAWTTLAGDENKNNDTLYYTLKHLPNNPIALPFSESFEQTNIQLAKATFGMNGIEYADYYPEIESRLRTNEGDVYSLTGNRALTMDNSREIMQRKNEIIFTYNLSNYVDSVLFFDFNYMNRSEPDGNDTIFARGDDTKPWIPIYNLFENKGTVGKYKNVAAINLLQKLKIENGQAFSSSTQLKITQNGIKKAVSPNGNGAYTFDDLKLYHAGKDVALINVSAKKMNCSKSFSSIPITIQIKNNSTQTITNLPVFYQINNNAVVSATMPNILNNDTASFTFNIPFTNSNAGLYQLKTWVKNAGDYITANDSIITETILVLPSIDSFPYYNDFETNNGNMFAEGTNNSWLWTAPQKYNINNAAQENKAWTTGQNVGYNFNENSYLYIGCMDFSSFTSDPLIAFNFISVMQTQSDSAYAEYSTNGIDWERLGCFDCDLNWYNGFQNQPYWDQTVFPWQVAHNKIPLANLVDSSNFMLRIHLQSDEFAVSEGIGIDDIHILKDYHEIATADSGFISSISTGNGWISFFRNGRLVAELFDDHKNLGNVSLGFEANTNKRKTYKGKNIVPRNWIFQPQHRILGNYKLRLYLLNDEYTNYTIEEDSISRMGDIGLLRYIGLNTNLDIIDNYVNAYYKYYSPQQIQFYPYQNGYFVEFQTDTLGEFYLLSTKQDYNAIGSANLIDFNVNRVNDDVFLEWKTTVELNNKEFIIQYSFDATTFINIDTIPAGNNSSATTLYNYLHALNATSGIYYYRIAIVSNSNKKSYSQIDSVYFAPIVGVNQNTHAVKSFITINDIVLEFKNVIHTQAEVNVFNALGQLQFTKKMWLQNGIQALQIPNFESWSNGTLLLQIKTNTQNYYSKLIKQ